MCRRSCLGVVANTLKRQHHSKRVSKLQLWPLHFTFETNTPGKKYEPVLTLHLSSGLNSITIALLQEWLWTLDNPQRFDIPLNKETKPKPNYSIFVVLIWLIFFANLIHLNFVMGDHSEGF